MTTPSLARRVMHRLVGGSETFQLAHPAALTVGRHTYFSEGCVVRTWAASERIAIGSFCSISDEVRILHPGVNEVLLDEHGDQVRLRLRGNHRFESATTFPIGILLPDVAFDEVPADGSLTSRPLTIGHDVWIGHRSMIVGPVTVGHGAIVGAGSVVLSDVPPYTLVAGNPARVVRHRFSPDVTRTMLDLAWWDWPDEEILANAEWFMGPIGAFVEHFERAR